MVGDGDSLAEGDADGEGDSLAEGEADMDGVMDAEGDGLPDGEGEGHAGAAGGAASSDDVEDVAPTATPAPATTNTTPAASPPILGETFTMRNPSAGTIEPTQPTATVPGNPFLRAPSLVSVRDPQGGVIGRPPVIRGGWPDAART